MRSVSSLLVVGAGFAALCAAAPVVPASHVVHEARESVPTGWQKSARVESDSSIVVRIGLSQSNLDKAEDYLMAV